MRVAVTGASGFVGYAIAKALEAKGHEIIGFGRQPNPGLKSYRQWDITTTAPPNVPKKVDAVIHAAAKVGDWGAYADYEKVNITGTANVARQFFEASQFIYISTASVYEAQNDAIPESAEPRTTFLNHYTQTKRVAEQRLLADRPHGLVIVRPHIIYGEGDTTLLPRILQARRFGRMLAAGNGANKVSVTYIGNLTAAIETLLAHPSSGPTVVNVADAVTPTVRQLLTAVREAFDLTEQLLFVPRTIASPVASVLEQAYSLARSRQAPILTRYIVEQLCNEYVLDIKKLHGMGYQPAVDYRAGLHAAAEWYKQQGN
jgi:nucleoside-diphosphate-sugar epimerase